MFVNTFMPLVAFGRSLAMLRRALNFAATRGGMSMYSVCISHVCFHCLLDSGHGFIYFSQEFRLIVRLDVDGIIA